MVSIHANASRTHQAQQQATISNLSAPRSLELHGRFLIGFKRYDDV